MRTITVLGGVIGSAALLGAASGVLPEVARGVGLVFLALVAALLGLRVVATAPWWLRAVVGPGAMLLGLVVWFAAEAEVGSDRLSWAVGVLGLGGFGIAAVLTLVTRRPHGRPSRRPGPRDPGVRVPAPRAPQPAHRSSRKGAHAR